MPLKAPSTGQTFSIRRMVSLTTLAITLAVLVLLLRQPKPVAPPRSHEQLTSGAQSLQVKVDQLATPVTNNQPVEPIRLNSDEVAAAIAQAVGTLPASGAGSATPPSDGASAIAAMDGVPTLSEPIVSFEGDQVKGQFVSELAGKKIYVTVSGRLGAKDGYATFDPTEFKVGDLNVPVSLVNDALQKKMTEERDKLKLPDFVSDVRVENGELVVTRK